MVNHTKDKIAFIGFAGSGKDTATNYLIKNYNFTKVSFANKLKQAVGLVFNTDYKLFEVEEFKKTVGPGNNTWRYWLQYIGTQGFRALWEDVWVEAALTEISTNNIEKVIVSDCRFVNEVNALRQAGFYIVYVERESIIPNWIKLVISLLGTNKLSQTIVKLFNPKFGHESEFNIFKLKKEADYIIYNNYDLTNLFMVLNDLVK